MAAGTGLNHGRDGVHDLKLTDEICTMCSEALFVRPDAFATQYPERYGLLARDYRQDPARTGVLKNSSTA